VSLYKAAEPLFNKNSKENPHRQKLLAVL